MAFCYLPGRLNDASFCEYADESSVVRSISGLFSKAVSRERRTLTLYLAATVLRLALLTRGLDGTLPEFMISLESIGAVDEKIPCETKTQVFDVKHSRDFDASHWFFCDGEVRRNYRSSPTINL